jgi:hypothetical protein
MSLQNQEDITADSRKQEGPAAERRTQKEDIFMETPAITVHTRLTRTSYRKYMYFHVFRKDSAWLKFTAMCLLVLLFGLINFRTGSPGLGWVFVLLAAYLLVSRYLRFFLSLNRICSQYGLDSLPRTFYSITFSPSGLDVSNKTEHASYPWKQVHHAYRRPGILYLYMNPQTAYLLPDGMIECGTLEDLWNLICSSLPPEKRTEYL